MEEYKKYQVWSLVFAIIAIVALLVALLVFVGSARSETTCADGIQCMTLTPSPMFYPYPEPTLPPYPAPIANFLPIVANAFDTIFLTSTAQP